MQRQRRHRRATLLSSVLLFVSIALGGWLLGSMAHHPVRLAAAAERLPGIVAGEAALAGQTGAASLWAAASGTPSAVAQAPTPIAAEAGPGPLDPPEQKSLWQLKLDQLEVEPQTDASTKALLAHAELVVTSASLRPSLRAQPAQSTGANLVRIGTGFLYAVRPADSLSKIAKLFNTTIYALIQANALRDPNLIRVGQELWVPTTAPSGGTAAAGAVGDLLPLPAAAVAAPACVDRFDAYPAAILAYLNDAAPAVGDLVAFLRACGVLTDALGTVQRHALAGSGVSDYLVVIHDLAANPANPSGRLLVYHRQRSKRGYVLAGSKRTSGQLHFIAADDTDADGRRELIWTDTFCAPVACYSTLYVAQWNGLAYQDWIDREVTTVNATYLLQDTFAAGTGEEIVIYGNVNPPGAGSQRAATEIYGAPPGEPYRRMERLVYDLDNCYYVRLLSLDAQFATLLPSSLEAEPLANLIDAYRQAISTSDPARCLLIPDEILLLRDFALFRLVVLYTASEQADQATLFFNFMATPGWRALATAFRDGFAASGDLDLACAAVSQYAVSQPDSWAFLNTWDRGEQSLTAQTLCRYR